MRIVYTIGIDFGTANSCVAYATYADPGTGQVDPEPLRRPEVIPFHNHDTIPTAIHLGKNSGQGTLFGTAAEERAVLDPQRLLTGFKLHLGRPETGADALVMARHFLTYLRRRVAEFVPLDDPRSDERIETVVGHPVQWNADQREATLQAAAAAGFPNVRLEEESLAALYCHLFDERAGFRPEPGSHILTVDMGGGTTDFAFLQLPTAPDQRPVSIPVRPVPDGAPAFGGRHLDHLLLAHLARNWEEETVDLHRRALLREVRRFKEGFSNNLAEGARDYETLLLVGETPRRVSLSRVEFERVAEKYIHYFEVLVRGALTEAELQPDQVTQIILTGGHSRWYWVEQTLGRVFPHLAGSRKTLFRHTHPEQSVARGLAYGPLVHSQGGGFLAPLRRAAHPLWLHIPGNGTVEPVAVVSRGQILPYQTQAPLLFDVEQTAGGGKAQVSVQFLSGSRRTPLADRVATFDRGFWEQITRSLGSRLPWGSATRTDRFEVALELSVDEHELITAELQVTRFRGKRPVDIQRQRLEMKPMG